MRDSYKRYEAVDRLKIGRILKVETLKQNQTFMPFFDNLSLGASKIQYLDNPFVPNPTDKIQINEIEILDNFREENLEKIAQKLLVFKRKNEDLEGKRVGKKEKAREKTKNNGEFITRIAEEFVFKNPFDFEGVPYLQNDKL